MGSIEATAEEISAFLPAAKFIAGFLPGEDAAKFVSVVSTLQEVIPVLVKAWPDVEKAINELIPAVRIVMNQIDVHMTNNPGVTREQAVAHVTGRMGPDFDWSIQGP